MTAQQSYINGFVKRAADYGFNRIAAESIFKRAAMKMQQPIVPPQPAPVPNINQQDNEFLNGGTGEEATQYMQTPPQPTPSRASAMPAPVVPPSQPVTATIQPTMPENPAGPNNDFLTKVMGSYNPKSRLDQQKANRIRQIYRPNMKPNEVYRDAQYSAIR